MQKVRFFAYLFITVSVLLYAGVRLLGGDTRAARLRIYTDTGQLDEEIRQYLAQNTNNLRDISDEILEKFPTLEHVSVKNNLSGTLEVRARHKKIVGVWTDGKANYPLLENGTYLTTPFPPGFKYARGMLFFRGPMPKDIAPIRAAMWSYPELAQKTEYLEYTESRRWNIKLSGGGIIMLPEQNPAAAVGQIRQLGVLGKKFGVLDLRDPKRVLVK